MVWYSHLFKNVPQFVVIHTVKDFGIVNKAEVELDMEQQTDSKSGMEYIKVAYCHPAYLTYVQSMS